MKNVKTIHRQITIYKRKGVIYGISLFMHRMYCHISCMLYLAFNTKKARSGCMRNNNVYQIQNEGVSI